MTEFIGVHVGAGCHADDLQKEYKKICCKACIEGMQVLKSGGSSLEAVSAAAVVLENSSFTNAGYGSNLTWHGKVECDASVMDGATLNFGAVGAVPGMSNPVLIARHLCEKQGQSLACGRVPPCFLVGKGAREWAKEAGLTDYLNKNLVAEKSLKLHQHYKRKLEKFEMQTGKVLSPLDTVGVVCLDRIGNVAAACSSGGIPLKHPGRVGQAAVYGCGCWAENAEGSKPAVATSSSGVGEFLIRTCLARESAVQLKENSCSVENLYRSMKEKFLDSSFLRKVEDKLGGVIVLRVSHDENVGEFLWSHTTSSMVVGYMSGTDKKPKARMSTLPANGSPGKTIVVEGITFKHTGCSTCENTASSNTSQELRETEVLNQANTV